MTLVWSNGGGTQSTAILALIVQGILPRPDVAIFADTGREKTQTWEYLDRVHRPVLAALGLPLTVASHDTSRCDLYAGNELVIPAYGHANGKVAKLRPFCSGRWKREVVRGHMVSLGHKKYTQWLGISIDESDRALVSKPRAWVQVRYPLIDQGMSRDDCTSVIRRMGWPQAPKSSCWMCPNIGNAEWRHMQKHYPQDFARAVKLDDQIRARDDLYLHRSLRPLSTLDLATPGLFDDDQVSCATNGGCWT